MIYTNLQILNAWSLIGNITISGNCCVRIYKSYMHEHSCFCSLAKFRYVLCTNLLILYTQVHRNM